MPPEIILYISQYGYLAIFLLIFLQEIGMPNPIPNELMLLFCGYLAFKGILELSVVFLTALSADFIGTNILYFTFYFFGGYILQRKPRWFPVSQKTINKLSVQVLKGGKWKMYLLRLTPFIRGYTSVVTGLLQIKPKTFLPIALFSAMTWSGAYILTGKLLGPRWSFIEKNIHNIKYIMLLALIIILALLSIRYFIKHDTDKTH